MSCRTNLSSKKEQKKSPDQIKFDPGMPWYYPRIDVFPGPRGKTLYFSGRSSDFRIVLHVAPSQPFGQ